MIKSNKNQKKLSKSSISKTSSKKKKSSSKSASSIGKKSSKTKRTSRSQKSCSKSNKKTSSKTLSFFEQIKKQKPSDRWVVRIPMGFPFDYSQLTALKKESIVWDKTYKTTIYEGSHLPPKWQAHLPLPYSLYWHLQKRFHPDLKAPIAPLNERWGLRPHQVDAYKSIELAYKNQMPGFLIADDVGLGKTASAWWFTLKQKWAKKVLIVSPLSVLAHWRTTLYHLGDEGKDIVLVNYDILSKLLSPKEGLSDRAKGKKKRIAKNSQVPEFDLIIWDEAHKGKNPTSARSIMMRRLSQKAKFCLWLTATPAQEPLELSYLAPVLSHKTGSPIDASELKTFALWCQNQDLGIVQGEFGKWHRTQDEKEKSRTAQKIHHLFFGPPVPIAIRRLPEQISDWPSFSRQLRLVDMEMKQEQAYNKAWEVFKDIENQSPYSKRKTTPQKQKKPSNMLVHYLRLRQASSFVRQESTIEVCEEMLENHKQVAISVAFLDTLQNLSQKMREKGWSVSEIHGRQNASERESERLKFQSGQSQVMIFTVEEGISLHQGELSVKGHQNAKPRVLLIHDLRWSALQMAQIEGRCHRDGKNAPSLWLVAPNTIDEKIATILLSRMKTLKTMMGDDTELLEEIFSLLEKESLN